MRLSTSAVDVLCVPHQILLSRVPSGFLTALPQARVSIGPAMANAAKAKVKSQEDCIVDRKI